MYNTCKQLLLTIQLVTLYMYYLAEIDCLIIHNYIYGRMISATNNILLKSFGLVRGLEVQMHVQLQAPSLAETLIGQDDKFSGKLSHSGLMHVNVM